MNKKGENPMKIYPELIYVCPLTKDTFAVPKDYCTKTAASIRLGKPRPCPYYEGTERDGWGPSVFFDVILCNPPNSTQKRLRADKNELG